MIDPALISYRPATAADFDYLWALHSESLRESIDRVYGWEDEWQANYFQERFDPPTRQIILYDQKPAGALGLEWQEKALYIAYIAISQDYRGQGLGSTIIKAIIRRGSEAGLPVTLNVLRGNPAKKLYERLGFEVIAEEETRFLMIHPFYL